MSAVAAQWMLACSDGFVAVLQARRSWLHAFMSVVTLGAWLPVWAARSGGRYRVVR